jgi:hypothetical protein
MQLVQQIAFVLCAGFATWLFSKNIMQIRRNILLGKDEDLGGNTAARWRNLVLLALGQQKMFKNPLVAIMQASSSLT